MSYRPIKVRPLNDAEKRRLRLAIATRLSLSRAEAGDTGSAPGRWLRRLDPCRPGAGAPLPDRLRAFFEDPLGEHTPYVHKWVLRYAPPSLLRRLTAHAGLAASPDPFLRVLAVTDPADLLSWDHVQPDVQVVRTGERPRRALVCFTGNALELNLPVRIFHALARPHFDVLVYLRDHRKQLFFDGIPTLAEDRMALEGWVKSRVPDDCALSVLGTSSGGVAAAFFAERFRARRLMLFGPPPQFRGLAPVGGTCRMNLDDVRVLFATESAMDQRYAAQWATTAYAPALEMLDTHRHGALGHLFLEDSRLDAVFSWLCGGGDDRRVSATAPVLPAGAAS